MRTALWQWEGLGILLAFPLVSIFRTKYFTICDATLPSLNAKWNMLGLPSFYEIYDFYAREYVSISATSAIFVALPSAPSVSVLQLLKSETLSLQLSLRMCTSLETFRRRHKTHYISSRPSYPLSAFLLALHIRRLLTIMRVYKLYLLTYFSLYQTL